VRERREMVEVTRRSCVCGRTFVALSDRKCWDCIEETIALQDLGRRFELEDAA
jgi:hypothetical protein